MTITDRLRKRQALTGKYLYAFWEVFFVGSIFITSILRFYGDSELKPINSPPSDGSQAFIALNMPVKIIIVLEIIYVYHNRLCQRGGGITKIKVTRRCY